MAICLQDIRDALIRHLAYVSSVLAHAEKLHQQKRLLSEPITMQDVRLYVGDGPLDAQAVLDAVNALLQSRR